MKLKSLIVLIIAIAIGGVAYYFSASPKDGLISNNSYLIPDLSEKLNDVTKLTMHEAGNTLLAEVSKSENNWVVTNRDGYEADIEAVRATFNKLSEAKLIEKKTSNPENYSKLEVEDIANENAQGVQFSIEGLSESINIIVGKEGSSGKNSQYIRRAGEEQSWLINKKLNLNLDVTQWLRKDILDFPPERLKNVQIAHTDGSVISIENKGAEEYEFTLSNSLPVGKKVSESEVYQVANALSSLQLRDVVSLKKFNGEITPSTITTFMTFDGLTVTAKTFSDDEESYVMLDISFNADHVDENIEKELDKSNVAINSEIVAAQELAQKTAPRIKGWGFVLPTITQDAMVKKLEDLLLDEDA